MKHIILATVFAMIFGLAAFAQTATPSEPRPTPQASNPTDSPAQSQTAPSQSPEMQNQNEKQNQTQANGEKKLKGCISSQGGTYTLQTKHGKEVALAGSADLASHVGHTVAVYGAYSNAVSGATTPTASAAPTDGTEHNNSATGGQFVVSKIEMVSDTCKEKDKEKDKMKSGQ